MEDTPIKTAKTEKLEVIMTADYWPDGKIEAIRKDIHGGEHIIEVDINLESPKSGKDARLRSGDVVTLPRKEAVNLVNKGLAKLPDME